MDLRSLMFNKCFCCSKNFNVDQLIEINSNSVIVAEEALNFGDLLLDICLHSIDTTKTSFICNECKNQVVLFHMFKRDIKKYSNFNEHIRNLTLLSKVESILNNIESPAEFQVSKQDDVIIISPCVEEETAEEVNEVIIDAQVTEEFVEEYIEDSSDIYRSLIPQETQIEEQKSEKDETLSEEKLPKISSRRSSRKYKYPINTNDKLTNEQKSWINQQVKECEVMKDGKIVYKCSLCETILRISGSLKKHLRDNHILKPEQSKRVLNDRKEFRNEVSQSKLTIETTDGPETIWKCQRCDYNRVFRSEAGLKVHIRYTHIRSQQIDVRFIARCRIEIEDENGFKVGWKCPECSKILRSRDGIRNHIKFEHPTLADETSSNEVATSEQFSNNDSNDYESLLNLLERKRRTLKSEVNGNSCKDCGIQFINGTSKKDKSLKIHRECHKILNVVSQFYQFPKCDITKTMFVNNEDLEKFLQSDQDFEPLPYDGMTSKVSLKLKEPLGTASIDDPDAWKCGHCGVGYLTEIECNSHLMILHSRKLICPVDHMEFDGNRGISQFNIHMRNKHSEMFPDLVIVCTYCQMEFSSIFEKLAHMKVCDEKKFECDHCSRKYFNKTQLIRHLKIASGEISYICDFCSKSCVSTMDLKLHRTSHTNERLYACSFPDCPKSFKTPAARSSHMETHGSSNYSCSACSASFRQRALLQRHIRKGFCKESLKSNSTKNFVVVEEMFDSDGQIFEVADILN